MRVNLLKRFELKFVSLRNLRQGILVCLEVSLLLDKWASVRVQRTSIKVAAYLFGLFPPVDRLCDLDEVLGEDI